VPVEVKNLSHVYMRGTPFETRALDNINFTINDGEFVGIIGHTGSGKSTLITHLNALIPPDEGAIIVNGLDLAAKETDLAKVRRMVGLVFQYPEYQLFEETVAKDIAFGPKNLGMDENEAELRVKEAMAQVGLAPELAEKSPFELSGGQKRRVAIAGVLAMKPDVLVLDEPAAGLDPVGRSDMLALIKSIHDSGRTVIMVSHSMNDVGRLCNRLIVMNHGKVAYDGTPAEVFTHPDELDSMGLGVPDSVRLAIKLRKAGYDIPETVTSVEALAGAILKNISRGSDSDA
jgi:energy-coupling factor transport system ATP-binding protein